MERPGGQPGRPLGAPHAQAAGGMPGGLFSMERARHMLRTYGRSGAFTYLSLSTLVTTGFYIAIEQNVDVKKIMGIKEDDPNAAPSRLQKLLLGPGSHIVLAVMCSKACIPLKLPVAVALTPYVHRLEVKLLQRWAAFRH
ncbi:MAG: hypothetical protein J3K34DRAFT_412492 [Monoraphidium minutum]|nr:MAG: hypothetical protein J3K34DRAFT_412492 [Monoraphidium minutum]